MNIHWKIILKNLESCGSRILQIFFPVGRDMDSLSYYGFPPNLDGFWLYLHGYMIFMIFFLKDHDICFWVSIGTLFFILKFVYWVLQVKFLTRYILDYIFKCCSCLFLNSSVDWICLNCFPFWVAICSTFEKFWHTFLISF